MNRFEPLIVRAPARSGPARAWAVDAIAARAPSGADLRGFMLAFVAGLVVFGTFLA